MSKSNISGEYICDVCGKLHARNPGNMYKLSWNGRIRHFCGYNCYIKILKLKEDKQYEEIDNIFNRDKSS